MIRGPNFVSKRTTRWFGYKVHLTETYLKENVTEVTFRGKKID